jgi:hypothetical protein
LSTRPSISSSALPITAAPVISRSEMRHGHSADDQMAESLCVPGARSTKDLSPDRRNIVGFCQIGLDHPLVCNNVRIGIEAGRRRLTLPRIG